jgi:phage terminase small subunit
MKAMRDVTRQRHSTDGQRLNGGDWIGKAIAAVADPRERRFVLEYAKSGNGKQSAVVAGYSVRSAHTLASRLLKKVYIRAALERLNAEIMAELNFTPDRILRELGRVAAADVDLKGNDKVKALTELAKLSGMYFGDRLEVRATVEHAHRIDIEALDVEKREQLRSALAALKARQVEKIDE